MRVRQSSLRLHNGKRNVIKQYFSALGNKPYISVGCVGIRAEITAYLFPLSVRSCYFVCALLIPGICVGIVFSVHLADGRHKRRAAAKRLNLIAQNIICSALERQRPVAARLPQSILLSGCRDNSDGGGAIVSHSGG